MSFAADIPTFFCLLRAEYAYNLESHRGEFIPVQVFAVDSIEGRAIGFDCLTNFGAMFARLPISAFCWKKNAPELALDMLELWNSFSYDVEAIEYRAIREFRCAVFRKDKIWVPGEYMFTLNWKGSKLAEDSGEGGFKRAHIVKGDDGNFYAQPNNRMRWFEMSFVTQPWPEKPGFRTNDHNWSAEQGDKWITENKKDFFYQCKETDGSGNSKTTPPVAG